MISRNKKIIFSRLTLVVTCGVALIISGCSCFSGYKRAVVNEIDISFSFDYPSSYKESGRTSDSFLTEIVLERYTPDRNIHKIDGQASVTIWKSLDYPNATAYLEFCLKTLQSQWGEFKLHERSTINVGGIDGEIIIYSGYFLTNVFTFDHIKCQEVFFDYKGMIWNITLFSDADAQKDESESDFEHLIKSFKFLD